MVIGQPIKEPHTGLKLYILLAPSISLDRLITATRFELIFLYEILKIHFCKRWAIMFVKRWAIMFVKRRWKDVEESKKDGYGHVVIFPLALHNSSCNFFMGPNLCTIRETLKLLINTPLKQSIQNLP